MACCIKYTAHWNCMENQNKCIHVSKEWKNWTLIIVGHSDDWDSVYVNFWHYEKKQTVKTCLWTVNFCNAAFEMLTSSPGCETPGEPSIRFTEVLWNGRRLSDLFLHLPAGPVFDCVLLTVTSGRGFWSSPFSVPPLTAIRWMVQRFRAPDLLKYIFPSAGLMQELQNPFV